MKQIITTATLIGVAAPSFADGHLDADTIAKIESWLVSIECQMDSDDIEVEDDGYDLDDVICKGGGQFDIKLDKDLNEVSRRAE